MSDFPNNISGQQADAMLSMAAKRLGKTPDELKRQLRGGDMSALTESLSEGQKQQVASMLRDPAAMQQFLQNPQVRQLLDRLAKGR
jgi:hypothetical protein